MYTHKEWNDTCVIMSFGAQIEGRTGGRNNWVSSIIWFYYWSRRGNARTASVGHWPDRWRNVAKCVDKSWCGSAACGVRVRYIVDEVACYVREVLAVGQAKAKAGGKLVGGGRGESDKRDVFVWTRKSWGRRSWVFLTGIERKSKVTCRHFRPYGKVSLNG